MKKNETLSAPMVAMLRSLAAGHGYTHHLRGQSAHGGAGKTLGALATRGLVVTFNGRDVVTGAGHAALKALKP